MIIIHYLSTMIIPFGAGLVLLLTPEKLERDPGRQNDARRYGLWIVGITACLNIFF
jgi:hypothetical protein